MSKAPYTAARYPAARYPAAREHVAVVGGGAAGMFAAILLARTGARVTLLDKDATPVPSTLADVGSWPRPGVPHTWHSHAFLARCRSLLAAHAPDLLKALLAAGVREIRLSDTAPTSLPGAAAGDPELVVLGARRAVVDWVLRRAVAIEPGVELRTGAKVAGLLARAATAGSPVRVEGVRFADGSRLEADLVVDAAGRLSRFGAWLAEAGAARPPETLVSCGIAYYSRFYRRADPDAPFPTPLNRGHTVGASFDRYSCLVFPADNDTFSVTFGVLPEDTALRILRHGSGFDAAVRSVPMVAPWLDELGVSPLTAVAAMSGMNNRVRPWIDGGRTGAGEDATGRDATGQIGAGRDTALNVLPVGDAAFITNPAHTRGTTLALLSAVRLAETVAATSDGQERAVRLDASLRSEFLPWFEDSCAQDADRLSRWRVPGYAEVPAARVGGGTPHPATVSNGEAYLASNRDLTVWHSFTRLQNLLATPAEVLGDPDFVARVRAVLATGWSPPRAAAPSHDDLVAVAAEATAIDKARRTGSGIS